MTSYYAAIFIASILTVIAQLLLKFSSQHHSYSFCFIQINRYLVFACILFLIIIFLSLYGLKKVPLTTMSGVYPAIQLTVVLCSQIFFQERLHYIQWLGIVILSVGLFVFYIE